MENFDGSQEETTSVNEGLDSMNEDELDENFVGEQDFLELDDLGGSLETDKKPTLVTDITRGPPKDESSEGTKNTTSGNVTDTKRSSGDGIKGLWIANLASETRAADLKSIFSNFGKVVSAKVVTSSSANSKRYYGYVVMEKSQDAQACVDNLNNTEIHGKVISVQKRKDEPGNKKKNDASKSTDKAAGRASSTSQKTKSSTEKPSPSSKSNSGTAAPVIDARQKIEEKGRKKDPSQSSSNGRKSSRARSHHSSERMSTKSRLLDSSSKSRRSRSRSREYEERKDELRRILDRKAELRKESDRIAREREQELLLREREERRLEEERNLLVRERLQREKIMKERLQLQREILMMERERKLEEEKLVEEAETLKKLTRARESEMNRSIDERRSVDERRRRHYDSPPRDRDHRDRNGDTSRRDPKYPRSDHDRDREDHGRSRAPSRDHRRRDPTPPRHTEDRDRSSRSSLERNRRVVSPPHSSANSMYNSRNDTISPRIIQNTGVPSHRAYDSRNDVIKRTISVQDSRNRVIPPDHPRALQQQQQQGSHSITAPAVLNVPASSSYGILPDPRSFYQQPPSSTGREYNSHHSDNNNYASEISYGSGRPQRGVGLR